MKSSEAAEGFILSLGFVLVSYPGGHVLKAHLLNHIARVFLL